MNLFNKLKMALPGQLDIDIDILIKNPGIPDNSLYLIAAEEAGVTITTDIELFLITDVFDVVFQSDPFIKMDLNYDIFVGSEGLKLIQEPWNADVINKVFPEYFGKCLNQDIICSGVIGGKREPLIDLYDEMFTMCENSLNGHNIKDQAALIIMIYNNQINNLKIYSSFCFNSTFNCISLSFISNIKQLFFFISISIFLI